MSGFNFTDFSIADANRQLDNTLREWRDAGASASDVTAAVNNLVDAKVSAMLKQIIEVFKP